MRQMLQQLYARLSSRERLVVLGGGVVVLASLLFVVVVDPLLDRRDLLDRQIVRKQRAIHELADLGAEYAVARARLARLEEQIAAAQGKFSLLSYLEKAASTAQVRDRITAIQPQTSPSAHGYKETSVEVRLEGVSLPQLLTLLVKLEGSPYLLQVKRMQMKSRFDAPHELDATLLVSTYEKER